jgi:uncharacterized protein
VRPNLTVVTLGVSNFQRSLRFYRDGLGLPTSAKKEDSIAFFEMNGVILALFERESLAHDARVSPAGSGFSGITLAHNAANEKEVDQIFVQIAEMDAKIVKKPDRTSWGGYGGYFADPDGHLWEVVYNPHWSLNRKGQIDLP